MVVGVEAFESELSVPVDYVPGARGHGILAVGADGSGSEALAVWRLSATGPAAGAWVVGFDEIERDPEQLRRIMWMLQDRCLVDWDAESPARILTRISGAVPGELLSALQRNILTTPELLAEISERRSSYAAAVEQHRARARSKVAPWHGPPKCPTSRSS